MTRKSQIKSFYSSTDYTTNMRQMDFVSAETKNCSYTIWFCSDGVEFNLNHMDSFSGYSYAEKFPLPIHNALITHYNLAAQIKAWNESHSL